MSTKKTKTQTQTKHKETAVRESKPDAKQPEIERAVAAVMSFGNINLRVVREFDKATGRAVFVTHLFKATNPTQTIQMNMIELLELHRAVGQVLDRATENSFQAFPLPPIEQPQPSR